MNRKESECRTNPSASNAQQEGGNAMLKYAIRKRCAQKITSFYRNVSKKYKHTYSITMMAKNIHDAYDSIFQIERNLLRREPIISRWKGYYMANTDKWYFAYSFDGCTITVVDACHAQNMHG